MNKMESKYYENMTLLRDISYTDKIIMDMIDLKRNYMPVFITNPPPDFKLLKKIKVQILMFFEPNINSVQYAERLKVVRRTRAITDSMYNLEEHIKIDTLIKTEEKIQIYFNALKNKCSAGYDKVHKIINRRQKEEEKKKEKENEKQGTSNYFMENKSEKSIRRFRSGKSSKTKVEMQRD